MNKASLYLSGLLALSSIAIAVAEETTIPAPASVPSSAVPVLAPAKPVPAPRSIVVKPVVKPVVAAPVTVGNTAAATTAPVATPAPVAAPAPAIENMLTAAPVATVELRRQQELLANAERVDKANRELLARNQELQLQNENLGIQNNVLKLDRSSEGIWKGAGAVIVGFLMGWFFASMGRRKSSW